MRLGTFRGTALKLSSYLTPCRYPNSYSAHRSPRPAARQLYLDDRYITSESQLARTHRLAQDTGTWLDSFGAGQSPEYTSVYAFQSRNLARDNPLTSPPLQAISSRQRSHTNAGTARNASPKRPKGIATRARSIGMPSNTRRRCLHVQ